MTELNITEAGTVQFPMVRHAAEIGWTPVLPKDALRRRAGETGTLFREELERALGRFNSWMTEDNIRSVVERLEAVPATIEGNREMLSWLRGERQWYDDEESRHRHVQIIDFEQPVENVLHVTWEWRLNPPARKGNRADVMFVINGVPVAIVEHKNPANANAIERGIAQLKRYEQETPELMGAAQLFNVTHLIDYWYGVTWNANRRFMARWKERRKESYRSAVQSFFEPTDFLRTLRDWILFYVEDGETRKSVLRQHQRRAIDRIIERCSEPKKRRGLIWHTQGSGKTFSLLTASRLILERKDLASTPTVVVVVDRTELEGQLKGWVERLLGEMQQQDIAVWQANSRLEIQELLKTDKRGLIISMIHKFEGIDRDANTRDNIFVFIDEAHRSVARDFGTYMMAAVPNATIIGFTGTPIARTDQGEGTFKIFGVDDELGYLDKYSIAESIEDETTLPLSHAMAPSEMTVPVERLDREFFELAEAEGVTDVEELNKVLDRAVGLRTFLAADDRIEKVASFVAKHFKENVLPLGFKAFLVGVNREACAKYKRALDKHMPPEWSEAVYTENAADVVERPLVAQLQLSAKREEDVRLLFKKAKENPKLLIVTDKLLTGYDASLLYCMYLDKPMRDHVLLQAIARVNRPHVDESGVGKRIGLVVDFVGVLRELKKAFRFDSTDVSGVIEDLDLLLKDCLDRIDRARIEYLGDPSNGGADERLEEVIYGRFLEPESRRTFSQDFKEIEVLWEILSPSPELRDHIETYKQIAKLYTVLINAYKANLTYEAPLGLKTHSLVQDSVSQGGFGDVVKEVTFDAPTVHALRDEQGCNEAKVFNLVRGLQVEIEADPDKAPVLRPLKDRAEHILEDLQSRKANSLAAIDQLAALAEEKEEAEEAANESGLSIRTFGLYWTFRKDESLSAAGIAPEDLAREADTLLARFPNAAQNVDEQRRFRAALYRPLLGVDGKERARIVDTAIEILLGTNDQS